MAKISEADVEAVRELVAAIPVGQVSTYGDLAAAAGLSSPRIVGWIMRTDTADLPWHRVVPASGRPAAHLATRQLERLRTEGVPHPRRPRRAARLPLGDPDAVTWRCGRERR